MTTAETPGIPEERITLEQLKHRVEAVRDLAVVEAKETVDEIVDVNATRTLLIMAGLVVAAASIAFFLGARSQPRYVEPPL